jgi:integrase
MSDLINTAAGETPIAARPAKRSAPKIAKAILTDKKVQALKKTKAAPGKRTMTWDGLVAGLAVRVTDQGYCSFVFGARYPGKKFWAVREIGGCDTMTLEAARAKAKNWIELIQKNIDPRAEADRLEKEEARKRADTFSSIAEEYILDKVIGDDTAHPLQRNGAVVARTIRNVFVAAWKDRPISGISREDVLAIIKASKRKNRRRGGPAAARASLGFIKSLFGWALHQGSYGLDRNVASDIEPRYIIGDKATGTRELSDDEILALWRAADRSAYPICEIYKLLLLTGLRLNEVCGARREEFDFKKGQWVIPSERMKGKNSGPKQARPFLVTLNSAMLQIIDTEANGFLFTTTRGRVQFHLGSKVKKAIDALMLVELQKIATERGDDPKNTVLPKWTNHDIRRSVRTNLSALKDAAGRKIPLEVKEAVLAHVKGALVGTYDLHDFKDEKAEALQLWSERLHEIVNPPAPDDGKVIHPRFGAKGLGKK